MYTILLNNQLTADVIMKIGSSQSFSAKTTRWSSVQSPCWLMFVGSLFNIYIYIYSSQHKGALAAAVR